MLFDPLSLFPFSLLDLAWISNTTTWSLPHLQQTPTYDFVVIGGGNAYVLVPLIIFFSLTYQKGVWQLRVVLRKILQSLLLYSKQVRMLNIFQRSFNPPPHGILYTQVVIKVFIPGLIGTGQSFTTLNWAYQTVPQEHLGNRHLVIGAGKALGGGTISTYFSSPFNQV